MLDSGSEFMVRRQVPYMHKWMGLLRIHAFSSRVNFVHSLCQRKDQLLLATSTATAHSQYILSVMRSLASNPVWLCELALELLHQRGEQGLSTGAVEAVRPLWLLQC